MKPTILPRLLLPALGAAALLPTSAEAHFIAIEWIKEQVAAAGGSGGQALLYLKLGVEHILIGYDHILFLIALILYGVRFMGNVKVITAFTLAHSITLALSVLELVTLPERLVESLIAASIVYVAVENYFVKDVSGRWKIAFLFGLIHGFGFAGVLREIGLPSDSLWLALLTFNLGVEIGQVLIVTGVYLVLTKAYHSPHFPRAASIGTSCIALMGGFWFVSRAFNLD